MKKTISGMFIIPILMTLWVAIVSHSTGMIAENLLIVTLLSYLLIPVACVILLVRMAKSKESKKAPAASWVLALVSLTGLPVPIKKDEVPEKKD